MNLELTPTQLRATRRACADRLTRLLIDDTIADALDPVGWQQATDALAITIDRIDSLLRTSAHTS
jgi:hypothetical protein